MTFVYFSDAWRRRRKLLLTNRERNQAIRKAELGTEFENNPEDEMDPPYQNDQAVELGADFENDPEAEVESEHQNDPEAELGTEFE